MRPWLVAMCVVSVLAALGSAQPDQDKKPVFKLSADEQKLLELTNAERKKEDLSSLKASPILFQLARSHSQNMAKQEKLDHDLDCKSPFDRLKDANYDFRHAAENIAQSVGEPTIADILKLWTDSEPHRANILKDGFTEIGLGIAKNDKGEVYCTQIFGTPVKKE